MLILTHTYHGLPKIWRKTHKALQRKRKISLQGKSSVVTIVPMNFEFNSSWNREIVNLSTPFTALVWNEKRGRVHKFHENCVKWSRHPNFDCHLPSLRSKFGNRGTCHVSERWSSVGKERRERKKPILQSSLSNITHYDTDHNNNLMNVPPLSNIRLKGLFFKKRRIYFQT